MRRRFPILLAALFALLSAACDSGRPSSWSTAPAPASRDALPTPTGDSLSGRRLSPGCSAFGIGLFDVSFTGLVMAAAALALLHRLRARAESKFDPLAKLAPGPLVLAGVVEAEPGEPNPAVKVEIEQIGTETKNKSSWSHMWTEIDRTVTAHPFFVRRDDGVRVRVMPDDRVALHDTLSRIERTSAAVRTRIAELVPGERVHIMGRLAPTPNAQTAGGGGARQGVYRDAPSGPTLLPPTYGPMVISTEAPGHTESERARFHAGWAVAFALLWALFCGYGLWEAHLLLVDGVVVRATPTSTGTWRTWHKPKNSPGYWVTHYAVRAEHQPRRGAPLLFEEETSLDVHRCVTDRRCGKIPFLVSERSPSTYQIGYDPGITSGWLGCGVFAIIVSGLLYVGITFGSRPWYLQTKVTDSGSGKLPPFTPAQGARAPS